MWDRIKSIRIIIIPRQNVDIMRGKILSCDNSEEGGSISSCNKEGLYGKLLFESSLEKTGTLKGWQWGGKEPR